MESVSFTEKLTTAVSNFVITSLKRAWNLPFKLAFFLFALVTFGLLVSVETLIKHADELSHHGIASVIIYNASVLLIDAIVEVCKIVYVVISTVKSLFGPHPFRGVDYHSLVVPAIPLIDESTLVRYLKHVATCSAWTGSYWNIVTKWVAYFAGDEVCTANKILEGTDIEWLVSELTKGMYYGSYKTVEITSYSEHGPTTTSSACMEQYVYVGDWCVFLTAPTLLLGAIAIVLFLYIFLHKDTFKLVTVIF